MDRSRPLTQSESSASDIRADDPPLSIRVSLVHDYLTQRGGAERVVAGWLSCFPTAELSTSLYDPAATFEEFRGRVTYLSFLDRIPRDHLDARAVVPLLPRAMGSLKTDPHADVILASTSGFAHGVRSAAPVVAYCHSPARWLYEMDDYFVGRPVSKRLWKSISRPLMTWDKTAASRVSKYLCNSRHVRDRIWKAYGISADVVHPPVTIDVDGSSEPIGGLEPNSFILTVGRSRGYKNAELVAAACERLGLTLAAVGWEPSGRSAPARTLRLGKVSDAQLRWLYANASCFVTASREDFGLSPLEANSFGTQAVCPNDFGFLDTITPGVNGRFYEPSSFDDLCLRIQEAVRDPLDDDVVRLHAGHFSLAEHSKLLLHHLEIASLSAR